MVPAGTIGYLPRSVCEVSSQNAFWIRCFSRNSSTVFSCDQTIARRGHGRGTAFGQLSSDVIPFSSLPGAITVLLVTFCLAGLAGRWADVTGGDALTVCTHKSNPHSSFSNVGKCTSIVGKLCLSRGHRVKKFWKIYQTCKDVWWRSWLPQLHVPPLS